MTGLPRLSGQYPSWHCYDDPTEPHELVLCPETCKALQGDERAELVVDFECEPVILL